MSVSTDELRPGGVPEGNIPPDTEDEAHSELGASVCKRWWNCPGSVRLIRGMPNIAGKAAKEGTAAHRVADLCLIMKQDAIEYVGRVVEGVLVDEHMAESVQIFVDDCRQDVRPGENYFIERRFDLSKLDPPAPMFGRTDFCVWLRDGTLKSKDYKNGFRSVEPGEQGRYYALGAMLALPPGCPVKQVEITIVQPNGSGPKIKREMIDAVELAEWSIELMKRAEATQKPDAPCIPGDWCESTFCPALGKCAAQIEASRQTVAAVPPKLELATPAEIAALLDRLDEVEATVSAVRKVGYELAERGELPGYKLVAKRPTDRFSDPADAADNLTMIFGLPESAVYKPRETVTPAQARAALVEQSLSAAKQEGRKLTKKQAEIDAKAALKPLITSSSSGCNLVPDEDARAALPVAGSEFDALPPE